MSTEAELFLGITEPPPPRPGPKWNVAAALCPLSGGVACFVLMLLTSGTSSWRHIALGALVLFATCFVGFGLALLAFVRMERLWGLTLLALAVNAAPLVMVAGKLM
jgi:hypothetical protein